MSPQSPSLAAVATATLRAIRPEKPVDNHPSESGLCCEPEPDVTVPCLPDDWYEQASQWRRPRAQGESGASERNPPPLIAGKAPIASTPAAIADGYDRRACRSDSP